MQSSC